MDASADPARAPPTVTMIGNTAAIAKTYFWAAARETSETERDRATENAKETQPPEILRLRLSLRFRQA
jgi:hypothetical protein